MSEREEEEEEEEIFRPERSINRQHFIVGLVRDMQHQAMIRIAKCSSKTGAIFLGSEVDVIDIILNNDLIGIGDVSTATTKAFTTRFHHIRFLINCHILCSEKKR